MITNELKQRILDASPIESIVGDIVNLKKRGVNLIGCCPFHNEKTPSFTVSPAKGICKCFGCGKGGNAIDFIMEHESFTYIETMEYLAKKANIEIPKNADPEETKRMRQREGVQLLNDKAQAYFTDHFKQHSAYAYIKERGFDEATIEKFGLGVAMDQAEGLMGKMASLGHNASQMVYAGLAGKNDRGYYDKFRNRLMFPIYNVTGRIIGFTGRTLETDPEKSKKYPKYMNTPDTVLYDKSKALYGIQLAKSAISRQDEALLVEGNTDTMRMHQLGIENTVASCGTAFTEQQARLIHRFCGNLNILYDGDSAGLKAAHKAAKVALSVNLNVFVTFLDSGEDPDTYFKDTTIETARGLISERRTNYVVWRCGEIQAQKDPGERSKLIRSILEDIKVISDTVYYKETYKEVIRLLDIDVDEYQVTPKAEDVNEKDLFAFDDDAKKAIKKKKQVHLHNHQESTVAPIIQRIAENKREHIGYPGLLSDAHIGELTALTKNFVFEHHIHYPEDFNAIPPLVKQLVFLTTAQHIDITILSDNEEVSFIEWYLYWITNILLEQRSPASRKAAAERTVEFLSKLDPTTREIIVPETAKSLGMNKADLNRILKPYVTKEDNKHKQKKQAIIIDGTQRVFDINNLPDYVDQDFFNKYRYFPAQNSKGKKIFYVFANEYGALTTVGNFFMEPKFQVYHEDRMKNKRIVELNHAEMKLSKLVEIPSDEMIEFGAFKKFMWRQGPYLLTGAKAVHLEMILDSNVLKFPKTYEFEYYGTQGEGFFAFVNGIVTRDGIRFCDDMGLVTYGDKTYYSPVVSRLHSDLREEELIKKFGMKVHLKIDEPNDIKFRLWADTFHRVYKYNNNNYWALTMALMCGFRSDIFPIQREFTTLFFSGPTGSGKSKIAFSIRALFMKEDAPIFNLNNGTDAAFFSLLETFRDIPVLMDEYNDMQISDIKFQGLKSAVFDGEGRQKRKDASSNDLVTTEILAIPLLMGQESPERDDRSLGNRCVENNVPKRDDWTEEELKDYNLLKSMEQKGLSHILVSILSNRKHIQYHYRDILFEEQRRLREAMQKDGIPFIPRVSKSIAYFTAFVRTWEEHVVPKVDEDLSLPFTYEEFFPLACKKLEEQSEMINNTNRLSTFFKTLMNLAGMDDRVGIKEGRDYKIETIDQLEVRISKKELKVLDFTSPKKVIFLRLGNIHPKYQKLVGTQEHLKIGNLESYLKDHTAYLGPVKQTAFIYTEEVRVSKDGDSVTSKMSQQKIRTSAVALDYDMLKASFEFDLGERSFAGNMHNADEASISNEKQGKLDMEKGDNPNPKINHNENEGENDDDLPF